MDSAQFIVSGLVQGVFFRASTQSRARQLGLTGYAKNHVDGYVEVVATGTPHALDELEAWLHEGPPAARIDKVQRSSIDAKEFSGFVTR